MALNESNAGGTERDSRLERLYRDASREVPPAHLDSAILAAARREAGARPQPVSTALRRWRVPVSIAAVVVLTISLVTLVQEKGGERIVRVAPVAPPAAPAAAPTPTQSLPSLPRKAEQAPTRSTVVPSASVRPAPREDIARPSAAGIRGDSSQRDIATAAAQGDAGGAGAPAVAESQPEPFPVAPGAAERRAEPQPQAAPGEESLARRAPAPAPKEGGPAPAAGQARVLDRSRAGATAGKQQPAWHDLTGAPPQKWLERIAEYRRQGRIADAEALVAEFRRRFPDHPLPPNGEPQ